jgi:hypothetical protein
MSTSVILASAASAALATLYPDRPAAERQALIDLLLQVRSGVQCHYGDGGKGVVFTLSNPRHMLMYVMEMPSDRDPGEPALIRLRPKGTFEVRANGGITSYLAYSRTARYLMHKPHTPLTPREIPAFFAKTDVIACPYKTWSDNAYEDGLREHGRPGQEH